MDPFCSKEAFSKTVFYESKHFRILYDIRPVVRGHILFVTKRHVTNLLELTQGEVSDMHVAFAHVIPRVLSIYASTEQSYDITSQVGPYSGRSVPHLHFHIIPRNKNDDYQGEDKNIFEDLKLNKTSFAMSDVEKEVALLRNEFGYRPAQR